VRVVQRLRHFPRDPQDIGNREHAFAHQACAQRLAAGVRHDIPEPPGGVPRIEDGYDVRMDQNGNQVDLALEPLEAERGPELEIEHLQGDVPFLPEIACEVYGRHAATPELTLEHVAVAKSVG